MGGAAGTIVVVGATVLFGLMVVDVAFGSDYTHQALDYAADTATNAWDWMQEELSTDGNSGIIINADPLPESIDSTESFGPLEPIDYGFLPSPLDASLDVGISGFPLPEGQGMLIDSSSPNQMNEEIKKGKAPKGFKRVEPGKGPFEKEHVHINGGALNKDGTWKHEPKSRLTNKQKPWLRSHGWSLFQD